MLAILTTHPIQYQTPLWQALAEDGSVPFEVWFLSKHGLKKSQDEGFGKKFAWDIDLLSRYPHRFLRTNTNSSVSSFYRLRLAEPLGREFVERKVSALWIQGWQVMAYWQAVREAHRAGIPVWLRGESNDLGGMPLWKRVIKPVILRQLFRRIETFLYIGTANRRLYEKYGVQSYQLHSAPYSVDNERFARQAAESRPLRAKIRAEWRIPQTAFCILFCGKFIPKKRPMDLIKAAHLLSETPAEEKPERLKQAHLLFVGSGELGPELRQQCNVIFDAEVSSDAPFDRKYSTRPTASFTGFLNQTEISKAYVAADCLVLPSDYGETWGLVVNEAIASGLPAVVSSACGCAEDLIGTSGPYSLCFPLGDQVALTRAIVRSAKGLDVPTVESVMSKYNFNVSVRTVRELFSNLKTKS